MQVNPFLVTSFAVAALVDLLAPLALALFLARRYQGRWRFWLYGVLVFLLSQVLTRIPALVFLQTRPAVQSALKEPAWFWLFLFFAAFTAGLFEEGGRWLAFRFFVPAAGRHWRTALMLGAGHGGLESVGVGLLALAGLVGYLAVVLLPPETLGASAPQVEEARKQFAALRGWEPLLGAWERLGALAIQVALTVLVLQAFVRGRRWWWYALGAHTLVDFTTVGVLRLAGEAWGQPAGMLLTEGLVAVYALLAVGVIAALRPGHKGLASVETTEPAAAPAAAAGGEGTPAQGNPQCTSNGQDVPRRSQPARMRQSTPLSVPSVGGFRSSRVAEDSTSSALASLAPASACCVTLTQPGRKRAIPAREWLGRMSSSSACGRHELVHLLVEALDLEGG